MLLFKLLSVLLCYPQAETQAVLDEIAQLIITEPTLADAHKQELLNFITEYQQQPLLELQENYVNLFDRGRLLSLHLFEHVHGESRARGQAMVDLLALYNTHGFELTAKELPDYLPLLLEFLAHIPQETAFTLVQDLQPVISLLGARLQARHSHYAAIFLALQALTDPVIDIQTLQQQVKAEAKDQTLTDMDAIWEEEMVRFTNPPCPNAPPTAQEQPLVFTATRPPQTTPTY